MTVYSVHLTFYTNKYVTVNGNVCVLDKHKLGNEHGGRIARCPLEIIFLIYNGCHHHLVVCAYENLIITSMIKILLFIIDA